MVPYEPNWNSRTFASYKTRIRSLQNSLINWFVYSFTATAVPTDSKPEPTLKSLCISLSHILRSLFTSRDHRRGLLCSIHTQRLPCKGRLERLEQALESTNKSFPACYAMFIFAHCTLNKTVRKLFAVKQYKIVIFCSQKWSY